LLPPLQWYDILAQNGLFVEERVDIGEGIAIALDSSKRFPVNR